MIMITGAPKYNRCSCQKCGSHYATIINSDEELQKEACPSCNEKKLKLEGPLSAAEMSSMFSGGG
jgi:NAD-dependent SIR2 family protein deacetylase